MASLASRLWLGLSLLGTFALIIMAYGSTGNGPRESERDPFHLRQIRLEDVCQVGSGVGVVFKAKKRLWKFDIVQGG